MPGMKRMAQSTRRLSRRSRQQLVRRLPIPLRDLLVQARNVFDLLPSVIYDAGRFVRHSGAGRRSAPGARLRALITIDYHKLEKGLALRHPRPGFGLWVVERLLRNLGSAGNSRMDGMTPAAQQ